MWRVAIRPEWRVAHAAGAPLPLPALLQLLGAIQSGGSIAQAARAIGTSYRNAWGLLRDFEQEFGAPLVVKSRGQGTRLSPLAEKLLWADRRIAARLSPTLESLASELEGELESLLAPARSSVRISASYGFAVAALLEALSQKGTAVDLKYQNSTEAVAALTRQECDLAGFHVACDRFQTASVQPYLQWLDPARHVLVQLAYRTQGLFVPRGNPKGVRSIADLARPELRFVNRQRGSGTRMLLDLLLADGGISPQVIHGYESAEFTHAAVAAFIASGMADVGFGLETAARRFGLDFLPILRERYFFACEVAAIERAPLRLVLRLMRSSDFRAVVDALPGYDGRIAGTVVPVQQAFARSRK
jgi:molybdate transport repressor ModE-like protein